MEYIEPFVYLVNEMSPYLILGFFIAGILHVYVPKSIYSNHLSQNNTKSVFIAALFGVPLPLCSCGVIPTAMSLRKEGASKGATTSFLIATPQTGVDSIFATYSLMGFFFAIIRPIVALATAVVGGIIINKSEAKKEALSSEKKDENSTSSGSDCSNEANKKTAKEKIIEVFRYGFVEMIQDVGKWLVVGLIIAGVITILVPDTFFENYVSNPILCMIIVLAFSVPMYICATGSIPIAVALMLKGLSPGAALVLLMAGPATNAASMLVVGKVMGKRTLALYVSIIVAGAIISGLVIDYLLPTSWFVLPLNSHSMSCHEEGGWFKPLCSILFLLMLAYAFFAKYFQRRGTDNAITGRTYKISGMTCNHCRGSVEKSIREVSGVTAVSVSLEREEAVVEGNASENEIRKAIESIGFELKKRND